MAEMTVKPSFFSTRMAIIALTIVSSADKFANPQYKGNMTYSILSFLFVQEHVETSCEGAPVTCKYCRENVLRRDIERHERLACEEVPGSCDFQAVGCNYDKVCI